MIFYLCLGVADIVPPRLDPNEFPSIALLSVSKQIRAETRPILYGINFWSLNAMPIKPCPLETVDPDLFERIVIALGGNDLPDLDRRSMVSHMHRPDFDFGSSGPWTAHNKNMARMFTVHQLCNAKVFTAWDEKVDRLMAMKNLRLVQVYLGGLFCPHGCCRIGLLDETPVRRFLKYLSESDEPFVHGRPRVAFRGFISEKEMHIIYNEYGFPHYPKSWESKAQKMKSSGDQVNNEDGDVDKPENDNDGSRANGDEDSSKESSQAGGGDDGASVSELKEEYDDGEIPENSSDQGDNANKEFSADREAELLGVESDEESTIDKEVQN